MKENGDITVTLGIPAYGRVGYLREAVASALNQKVAPDEIIISQNAHADAQTDRAVREALQELATSSPLIRLNRNETRCNLSTNINSIADLATGDYVGLIGDDDRFKPGFVRAVKEVAKEATPDVIFGNHDVIDVDGDVLREMSRRSIVRYHRDTLSEGPLGHKDSRTAAWRNSMPLFSAAIRTDVLRELRFVDDLHGADTEFFVRAAETDHSFYFTRDKLTDIRYHPGNIPKPGSQYARLVDYLSRVEADESSVRLKRDLLSQYTAVTAKKLIIEGHVSEARSFLTTFGDSVNNVVRSKIAFQRFCLRFPDQIARRVYSTVASAVHAISDTAEV